MLTRRRFGTGALAALAGAAAGGIGLAGCAGPSHGLRYRLRLDVETPEGLKTGASVISLSVRHITAIDVGGSYPREIRGEAIAVDLGPRGVLFALLSPDSQRKSSQSAENIAQAALGFKGGNETLLPWIDAAQAQKTKADLSPDILPMLVRFRDINDPKTVERVDPNNLAAAFGQGVRLARASIEITNDPVTTGIEKKIGWWFAQAKPPYDPPELRYPNKSPRGYGTLSVLDFIQGLPWRQK